MKETMRQIVLLLALANCAGAMSLDLPGVGTITLSNEWSVVGSGTNSQNNSQWGVVLKKGDELLSFVLWEPNDSPTVNYCDSTHELAPRGCPYWLEKVSGGFTNGESTTWGLRARITDMFVYEALEYSMVTGTVGMPANTLGHGFVLFGDRTVFVQHSSSRAITPEFVHGVAASVMSELSRTKSKHMRLFTKPQTI